MDEARALLYPFLEDVEDTHLQVYRDTKNNPTIGTGFNLDAPGAEEHLTPLKLSKEKLMGGHVITPEEARRLMDQKVHENEKLFSSMQKNYFPTTKLNPAQQAALLSMMYNNPSLIGPQMREHLNQNDTPAVIKEIMLRSNKAKDPGILKRRIQEAELYGGPVDFNTTIKSMDPEELAEIKSIMSSMTNQNELTRLQEKYPFLKEERQPAGLPVNFNKLLRGFNGR